MTYQAILQGKIPNEALEGAREDVLTASVLGAVAYAPRAVRQAFLSEIVRVDLGDPDAVAFSFWPWMRTASRIELVDVHPFDVLAADTSADELARLLEAIVTCARGVTGLNAP